MSSQPFKYYLVLDFEATCDDQPKFGPPEIIEFPTVLYNSETNKVEDEFQFFVKPVLNPTLTKFCTELTGIQQDQVENGTSLPEVLKKYDSWLSERGILNESFAFVTCGDWDLKTMLPNQCDNLKLSSNDYFKKWVNIKKVFCNFYRTKRLKGMAEMLEFLKLDLLGKHHSGIDDCRNICRILQKMVQDGCTINLTTKNTTVNTPQPSKGNMNSDNSQTTKEEVTN